MIFILFLIFQLIWADIYVASSGQASSVHNSDESTLPTHSLCDSDVSTGSGNSFFRSNKYKIATFACMMKIKNLKHDKKYSHKSINIIISGSWKSL